jgi:hypothetical protein
MIATLRWRLIAVPGRLVRHARHLILRLRPATACSPRSWPGCGTCPHPPDLHTLSLGSPSLSTACRSDPKKGPQIANPARLPGHQPARYRESWHTKSVCRQQSAHRAIRGIGSERIPVTNPTLA